MTEKEINDNKIYHCIVGSKLYGTNTPMSDEDFSGIFIAPKPYYLGLSHVEEVDCSFVSKLANGKNASDAIDFKLYELRKFMKLAMDNNPNILEHLFVPDDQVLFASSAGKRLLDNAHLFPWKGLKQKFLGYAFSQKHKMLIKVDNYTGLTEFNDWLKEHTLNPREDTMCHGAYFTNQLLAELRDKKVPGIKFHEHHATVGDINISLTDKLSKVGNKVRERLSKVGNREELYTKYGYDTKFGMHLVRLMLEGKELLQTGKLVYPLKERDLLLAMRNGEWAREDIISYSEQLESEIESIVEKSDLPSKPRYQEIETLLIDMVQNHWGE